MTGLYRVLAVSNHHPEGTCWAWLDRGAVCGRPESADEPHLCTRHIRVAYRRRDKRELEGVEIARRAEARAAARQQDLDAALAHVDARIAAKPYAARARLHDRRRRLIALGATTQEVAS